MSSLLGLACSTLSSEFLGVLGDHLKGDLDSNFLVQANDTGVLTRGLDALVNAHDLAVNIVTSGEKSLVYLCSANRTVDGARGAHLNGDGQGYTLKCLAASSRRLSP